MPEKKIVPAQTEILPVKGSKIACDGRDEFSTHPRIFLPVSKDEVTVCPYCSLRYKQDQNFVVGTAH